MAEVKKRYYRLFKVAKELNVASDTLVEHLRGAGHDIDTSPNTKISSDQYDILLKKFASDKVVKERAEQIVEKRKEDHKTGKEEGEEENDQAHISPSQLRNTILPKKKRRRSSSNSNSGGETPAIKEEASTETAPPKPEKESSNHINTVTESTPEVDEPVKEEPAKPADANPDTDAPADSKPQIKIIGKIDLDSINRGGKGQNRKNKGRPEKQTKTESLKTSTPTPVEKPVSTPTPIEKENRKDTDEKQKQADQAPVPTKEPISRKQEEKGGKEETIKTVPKDNDETVAKEKAQPQKPEKESKPVQEAKAKPVEAKETPKESKPVAKTPQEQISKPREEKAQKESAKPQTENKPVAEEKKVESPRDKEPEKRKASEESPKEQKLVVKPENQEDTPANDGEGEEGEGEGKTTMRAGDRTPKLSGLKVMGKIELPGSGGGGRRTRKRKDKNKNRPQQENQGQRSGGDRDRPRGESNDSKKKSEEKERPTRPTPSNSNRPNNNQGQGNAQQKPVKQTSSENDGESEEDKKKRRRRRKRKRKPSGATETQGSNTNNNNNNNNNKSSDKRTSGGSGNTGRRKKEKPSEGEVEKSIRSTLNQMSQAPSRRRQKMRRAKRDTEAAKREKELQEAEAAAKVLQVTEFITANEFADMIEMPVNEIIKKSFELGMMVSINQRLDAELISIIAEEYGYEVEFIDVKEKEFEFEVEADDEKDLETRSPIITVMGHVDHGKTTLLDYLRKTNVTSQEAGGITQHIGAYQVALESGNKVTFLDTPGHEAFTAMRARGAKATDVVIVVVAADDAVMPQTKEAINHAEAASVPIVFAINKIDKASANPERIKGQLAEMNYMVEDWGGKYQSQEISALKGVNVDELLEKVILESDLLELKANPDRVASGTVIESRLDKGRGIVATVLVQNGTLKIGDPLIAGVHFGKIRAMINQNGQRVKEAGPSTPVQILGLGGQPQAGDRFQVFDDESRAKEISQKRQELFREQQLRQTKRITLDEIGRRRAIGTFEELNVIIKGDVDGSVEALAGSLLKLSTDEVQVNILLKGVGAITEGDVLLASASDAIIIAFNVRPNAQARKLADKEEIDIRTYSVIYDAINDVKDALEGLLSPELKEEMMGTAEVREVFKISKVGTVAGTYVTSGKIVRNDPVRIIREGVVIYDSVLTSLKRYKDDVKEVSAGYECGMMVENYNDIRVGDIIESYHVNEIRRKLASAN